MTDKKYWFGFVVFCCFVLVLSVAIWPSVGLKADEPKPQPAVDNPKAEQSADPVDKKKFEMTKLSAQVYLVKVWANSDGWDQYQKEWVDFCKEHPTARCHQAPPNPNGNVAFTWYYWNVDEK